MMVVEASSPTAPTSARRRAGAPAPMSAIADPALNAPPEAKTNGSSPRASCHTGMAVSAMSTAVDGARAGPSTGVAPGRARTQGGGARQAPQAREPAEQAARVPEGDGGAGGAEDPRADAHRRRRLEHPQHVVEALRTPEVGDQQRRARRHTGQRDQPRAPRERVVAAQLADEGEGRRRAGHPAEEEVDGDLPRP